MISIKNALYFRHNIEKKLSALIKLMRQYPILSGKKAQKQQDKINKDSNMTA